VAKKIKGVNLIPEVTTRPRLEAFVKKHVFNAAGSNTQIQFNDAGSFAGDPSLVWDVTHPNDGLGIFLDETGRGPKVHLDVNYGYLDELAADSGGGASVAFGSGTTIAGKLYYLETSGEWLQTDADILASGSTQLLAIALGTDAADDGMLIHGFFNMDSYLGSFSKGVPVYVSTDVGQATLTPPAGAGDFTRVIGHCTEYSNVIYFNPNEQSGSGGAAGIIGGSNTQVQFNNGGSFDGSANLTFNGTTLTAAGISSTGNTTLGDASGDSVTINAETIVLSNVDTGTDNTVLVYNGSSIVTDEIDSRVWGSTLLDASGTPADNQVGVWTDANTLEGTSNFTFDGTDLTVTADVLPGADDTHDLGSAAARWANVYTGDLHLVNDRGDWTVVEEEDYITVRNNKTGKRFKLLMEEID